MINLNAFSLLARAKAPAAALASALALTGCISPVAGPGGNYTTPIGGSPVTANPTPYSKGLVCMGHFARQSKVRAPRIAVGRILDYTGKADIEGGRRVTQGGSLMAMSALAKAGAVLVERFDTSVAELDLKYKNNKLVGENGNFTKIHAGSIPGSFGIFDFANGNVFDVGAGTRAQEPIQLAVRSVIERASLEMMANLYGAPNADVCSLTRGAISSNSVTGDYRPVRAKLDEYNGPSRQSASKWHDKRDSGFRGTQSK